eukprot:3045514-Pleurochrysis_carterae.AAC.1
MNTRAREQDIDAQTVSAPCPTRSCRNERIGLRFGRCVRYTKGLQGHHLLSWRHRPETGD